jgi:hypothetical protein
LGTQSAYATWVLPPDAALPHTAVQYRGFVPVTGFPPASDGKVDSRSSLRSVVRAPPPVAWFPAPQSAVFVAAVVAVLV